MSQGRRHFTDEFKREAVALLGSSGRPLSRIASELGISRSMMEKHGYGPDHRLAVKVATRNIAQYRDPAIILIDQMKGSTLTAS
jgi:transposase-like protein